MCEFSTMARQSRKARQGETLTVQGMSGERNMLASGNDCTTAVCIANNTELQLSGIPAKLQQRAGVGPEATVTFLTDERQHGSDQVRFENGQTLYFQELPQGLNVRVVSIPLQAGDEVPIELVAATAVPVEAELELVTA